MNRLIWSIVLMVLACALLKAYTSAAYPNHSTTEASVNRPK